MFVMLLRRTSMNLQLLAFLTPVSHHPLTPTITIPQFQDPGPLVRKTASASIHQYHRSSQEHPEPKIHHQATNIPSTEAASTMAPALCIQITGHLEPIMEVNLRKPATRTTATVISTIIVLNILNINIPTSRTITGMH